MEVSLVWSSLRVLFSPGTLKLPEARARDKTTRVGAVPRTLVPSSCSGTRANECWHANSKYRTPPTAQSSECPALTVGPRALEARWRRGG